MLLKELLKLHEYRVAEGLNEAIGGNYLYHSTQNANTAKAILSSGFFKASNGNHQSATDAQIGEVPAVCFGRDLASQLSGKSVSRNYQVVFVVDRNALESRYKTICTSQSSVIHGLGYGRIGKKGTRQNETPWLVKMYKGQNKRSIDGLDINKDGKISKDEMERDPEMYLHHVANKAGNEYEEVVPTKTGKIPLKDILVGFYLVPGKAASEDAELLNHPLRLDMPRPNQFVKATTKERRS